MGYAVLVRRVIRHFAACKDLHKYCAPLGDTAQKPFATEPGSCQAASRFSWIVHPLYMIVFISLSFGERVSGNWERGVIRSGL